MKPSCVWFQIVLLLLTFHTSASSARILEDLTVTSQFPLPDPVEPPQEAPPATVTAPSPVFAPLPGSHDADEAPPPITATPPASSGGISSENSTLSFFMHDILGGSHPSGRVVTGIVANSGANELPFSKPNNLIFPINGGVPLNNINNVINNNNYPFLIGLNGSPATQSNGNNPGNQAFVTAGQLPAGLTLQQLMFGSVTVVDNELTEGHEIGSSVIGKAQGFYLSSSVDGSSHTLVLTAVFHGGDHDVVDSICFFGIHRTATPISHIAIIGGTGKYENAKGYATIETLPHEDQHTTDGLETITHFTLFLTS